MHFLHLTEGVRLWFSSAHAGGAPEQPPVVGASLPAGPPASFKPSSLPLTRTCCQELSVMTVGVSGLLAGELKGRDGFGRRK